MSDSFVMFDDKAYLHRVSQQGGINDPVVCELSLVLLEYTGTVIEVPPKWATNATKPLRFKIEVFEDEPDGVSNELESPRLNETP